MSLVFIIEDEPIMAECIALAAEGSTTYPEDRHTNVLDSVDEVRAAEEQLDAPGSKPRTRIFGDAISAMEGLREELPDVILLDVMLTGPDGFTFLNEMASYSDTMRIPVVLVTTLNLASQNLEHYGVFRILNKTTMTPEDISSAVAEGVAISATRSASSPLPSPVLPLEPISESTTDAVVEQGVSGVAVTDTATADTENKLSEALNGLAKLQSSLRQLPTNPTNDQDTAGGS